MLTLEAEMRRMMDTEPGAPYPAIVHVEDTTAPFESYRMVASHEAAAKLRELSPGTPVRLSVRTRHVDLSSYTRGDQRGNAYRMSIADVALADGSKITAPLEALAL